METNSNSVKMFILPQQFPCGPQSSCCGPIGQSDEEIQNLKNEIEKELSCKVEVFDVTKGEDMKDNLQVLRLVRSFGPMSLPIITLNNEIVSMGNPTPKEAVLAIKEKMKQM